MAKKHLARGFMTCSLKQKTQMKSVQSAQSKDGSQSLESQYGLSLSYDVK